MFDFNKFVERHGEVAAQALLENVERFEGIRREMPVSLEERWHGVMTASTVAYQMAA